MPNSEQSRSFSPLPWAFGFVVLAAIAFFWVRSVTHSAVQVRVAAVSYQTLAKTVSTNGKVEPVEEFQAHAPFPGVIKKIFVEVGQHVTTGELLVKMDDSGAAARLASANAMLSQAQLSLHDMQSGGSFEERNRFGNDLASARLDQQDAANKYAATQKLFAQGAASAAEVAAAKQRLDASNLTLQIAQQRQSQRFNNLDIENAKAHVADLEANLVAAKNAYADVDIRSPQNGTVYSVPVSEYDFVPAGDDILDVADLNRIRVRAYFDEPEIGKLEPGQSVDIVWDAKPGQVWHGHIQVAPTTVITYGTRNVGECIITVDDAKGDLLPNTNVTVTVTEMRRTHVLSIPREALHTDGTNDYVYRIVDQKLTRTPVTVGVVNLTNVEIVSGLQANDQIVLGPKSTSVELVNGLKVKPIE